MASTTTEERLSIRRESLTPAGEHPGELLTDDQIRDLDILQPTFANRELVSFSAVGEDFLWSPHKEIYQANVASVQRVVRAHIAVRVAADAVRDASAAARATALATVASASAAAAVPVARGYGQPYPASAYGPTVPPGVNAAPAQSPRGSAFPAAAAAPVAPGSGQPSTAIARRSVFSRGENGGPMQPPQASAVPATAPVAIPAAAPAPVQNTPQNAPAQPEPDAPVIRPPYGRFW